MNAPAQVQDAMTPAEREAFLKHVHAQNRHWRGAHVADVLDEMNNLDLHCGFVEGMLEQQIIRAGVNALLFATAVRAMIFIKGSIAHVTLADVNDLVERVKQ